MFDNVFCLGLIGARDFIRKILGTTYLDCFDFFENENQKS